MWKAAFLPIVLAFLVTQHVQLLVYTSPTVPCSCVLRCHDADMLMQILEEKGVPAEPLSDYINAFR